MKCSACQSNECESYYRNRYLCRGTIEGVDCCCCCRRSPFGVFFSTLASCGFGTAAFIAGSKTLKYTEGTIYDIVCGALIGGGLTLIILQFLKIMTAECVSYKESARKFIKGAGVGAIICPILEAKSPILAIQAID